MSLHPKRRPGALMRLYAALDALELRIDSNINDVRRTQRDHLHGALENMRFELDQIGHQMNAASAAKPISFEFTPHSSYADTDIAADHAAGMRIHELAAKYHMSERGIRKAIARQAPPVMPESTSQVMREAARALALGAIYGNRPEPVSLIYLDYYLARALALPDQRETARNLDYLSKAGLVEQGTPGLWSITAAGIDAIELGDPRFEALNRHTQVFRRREKELREATEAAKQIRDSQPSIEALLSDVARCLKDLVRATERHADAVQRRGGA